MTRDLQTTIRYEHSLDSAMRPVRPDGTSRRTREHPCVARPIEGVSPAGDLRIAAT
jgi:hypothetical protein